MEYQILLVDDESHVLKALVRLLRQNGIKALTASSGSEALAIMNSSAVPVVISDFKMPKMSGTELLAKIEATWPETVRIILSGHADFETVLEAVHSGVVHKFLAKPWNNQELVEHIKIALVQVDRSRGVKENRNAELAEPHVLTASDTVAGLSASQVQLQVVLDTVFDGIVTINRQGKILSINKAIERIFGYSQSELVGQNVSSLMPEPYRSQHDHYLSQFGTGDKGIIGNQRRLVGLRKNGEVFPIELGVNSMEIEGNTQFLGMIRDISRRVSAESENKLLIDALEIAQDGFALFGSGDRLLHCNQQFRKLYQDCEESLAEGVRYDEFFKLCIEKGLFVDAQKDPGTWLKRQSEAHQKLPIIQQYELEPGRWIEIHETRAENGSVIVSHLDISQLKQTQISLTNAVHEAELANSARGRFLAMMSHEIRTPLNGVLGLLQLLQDSPLNSSQLDYVNTALTSGQSLLTIISDILDFTKIEADKLELMEGPCSLLQLSQELISLFKLRVEEKSIQLSFSIDDQLPKIITLDGQRLRQVLLNLVGNGIKFTDKGRVDLEISLTSDMRIQFVVMDTGIGIPLDEQDQVFSEFSTLSNNSDGRVYEGTGLGLAISQKLVDLMGGVIRFESVPNQGSSFSFNLPLVEAANQNVLQQADVETFSLEGRVLLVDDSETNRLVAKLMLESAGAEVFCVSDGYQALEAYEGVMFDLILMDIAMPGIDGLETSDRLQKLEGWRNTPILALTAYAMPEDKQRFFQHGLIDHIEKPLEKQTLLRTLSAYIGLQDGGGISQEIDRMEQDNSATPLIVQSCLDKLALDTSEEVLPQLVEVFTTDAEKRLQELMSAEIDVIERHLHTLGSSAALYGLEPCSKQARLLEKKIINGLSVDEDLPGFLSLCEDSIMALKKTILQR